MPRIVACGSRNDAIDNFKTSREREPDVLALLLVDSEDPVADIERTWEHLRLRPGDQWIRPNGATDEHVFLMTTCTETWICADLAALRAYFGQAFRENAMPSMADMEERPRGEVLAALKQASAGCKKQYEKNQAFALVGQLSPDALDVLPSFARMRRLLREHVRPGA